MLILTFQSNLKTIMGPSSWANAHALPSLQPPIPVKDLPHTCVTRRGGRSPRGHVLEISAFTVDAAGPGATLRLGAVGDAGTQDSGGCAGTETAMNTRLLHAGRTSEPTVHVFESGKYKGFALVALSSNCAHVMLVPANNCSIFLRVDISDCVSLSQSMPAAHTSFHMYEKPLILRH